MIERIPLEDCEDRGIYLLRSRNLTMGVFRNCTQGFIGIREKFGSEYLFEECHFDTGAPYGTAHPYKIIGTLPYNIKATETLGDVCQSCRAVDQIFYVRFAEPIAVSDIYSQPGMWVCLNCTEPRAAYLDNPPLFEFLESIRCKSCGGAAEIWIPTDPKNKWADGKFGPCKECGGSGIDNF